MLHIIRVTIDILDLSHRFRTKEIFFYGYIFWLYTVLHAMYHTAAVWYVGTMYDTVCLSLYSALDAYR